MRNLSLTLTVVLFAIQLKAQETNEDAKFYIGASYGTSFAIADFKDTDVNNLSAGFAQDGQKIDVYGGFFLDEKWTLVGTFRYQSFETKIDDVVERYNEENPTTIFSGTTEDWRAHYFLLGITYKMKVTKKFAFYPRIGMGPMWVTNPGLDIVAQDDAITQNFIRTSETGLGLGYEFGIGLRNDFGKHFSLLPTFTFSGGFVNYSNVDTIVDGVPVISDYEPRIQSFTLGISLAYRFY